MLKCPKCGSENVDHCYTSDEIEIWCKDCHNRDEYYLPYVDQAFPDWYEEDEE